MTRDEGPALNRDISIGTLSISQLGETMMLTRTLTRLLMGIALLCATIAWSGWAYLHTVAAPHRVEDVADAVIADPEARFEIAGPLANQVVEATGIDPSFTPQVRDAVAITLADPRVAANVTAAFGSMHARAVGVADDRPSTIDGAVLIAAVREHLAVANPELAALIPDTAVGDLHLPDVHPPFVASLRRIAVASTGALALIALALLVVTLIIGDRKYALRRFGIWAIVTGALWAIGPRLAIAAAHRWSPDADATLAAAIGAATKDLTLAATVLVAAGIGAIIAGQLIGINVLPQPADISPTQRTVRPHRAPDFASYNRTPVPARPAPARPVSVGPAPTVFINPATDGWGIQLDDDFDPWAHFAAPAAPSKEPLDGA